MSDTHARTVRYVAESFIEPSPPPPSSKGAIHWMRENLFSSFTNAILTILSIALVVWLVPQLIDWAIVKAVVSPEIYSRRYCYDVNESAQLMGLASSFGIAGLAEIGALPVSEQVDALKPLLVAPMGQQALAGLELTLPAWLTGPMTAAAGQATVSGIEYHYGACWSVIQERFNQFVFGFYPADLYWRPILAFLGLGLALAPVLFNAVPRKLLWFTAVYPAVAYFLIWGGNVWGPLLVIATPLIAYLVYKLLDLFDAGVVSVLAAIAAAVLWLMFIVAPLDGAITRIIGDARYDGTVETMAAELEGEGIEDRFAAEVAEEFPDLTAEQRAAMAAELAGEYRNEQTRLLEEFRSLPERIAEVDAMKAEIAAEREALAEAISIIETYPDVAPADLDPSLFSDLDPAITENLVTRYAALLDTEGRIAGLESRIDAIYSRLGLVGLEEVESARLGGFLLTMIIGVVGITGSLPIGILLALGRKSNLFVVRTIATMFIEFIRGVPLITLLFVASTLLAYFLPPGTSFDLVLRVLIMVTLFASAYMAEVIRGGLAALPQGQYEAADAMGLNYWQSMRLIILPQALKISIPGIVNTFIGLFKDTTLVVIIGLSDPLGVINQIRGDVNWGGMVWELFSFVALFFFIFCFGMSRYSMHLERKLATDRR